MASASSQSTPGTTEGAEVTKIRKQLQEWARAVRKGDLEGVVAHHAEDIVYFDVPPPTQVKGLRGYTASWPPFFDYIGRTGGFDLDQLDIVAGQDVAFAHGILLVRGQSEDRPSEVRLTVGLRKLGDEWAVVHEHHSAPYG